MQHIRYVFVTSTFNGTAHLLMSTTRQAICKFGSSATDEFLAIVRQLCVSACTGKMQHKPRARLTSQKQCLGRGGCSWLIFTTVAEHLLVSAVCAIDYTVAYLLWHDALRLAYATVRVALWVIAGEVRTTWYACSKTKAAARNK